MSTYLPGRYRVCKAFEDLAVGTEVLLRPSSCVADSYRMSALDGSWYTWIDARTVAGHLEPVGKAVTR